MNIFENNALQDKQKLECWVFRIAQKKWGITGRDCIKIFKENDIFNIITENMIILKERSEEHIVCNIEDILEKVNAEELNKQIATLQNKKKVAKPQNIMYRTRKECRAVNVMQDMIYLLAERKHLTFEKALEKFVKTTMYEALFNYQTELWDKKPVCLLGIFDKWNTKKQIT